MITSKITITNHGPQQNCHAPIPVGRMAVLLGRPSRARSALSVKKIRKTGGADGPVRGKGWERDQPSELGVGEKRGMCPPRGAWQFCWWFFWEIKFKRNRIGRLALPSVGLLAFWPTGFRLLPG